MDAGCWGGVDSVSLSVPGIGIMSHSLAPEVHDSGNRDGRYCWAGLPSKERPSRNASPTPSPQAQNQLEPLCLGLREGVSLGVKPWKG